MLLLLNPPELLGWSLQILSVSFGNDSAILVFFKSIFSWEHFLCALTVCKDMLLRISYSAVFINEYFKVKFLECSTLGFFPCIRIAFVKKKNLMTYLQGSFSFYRCLPAGWGVLLISGLTTAFSERMFLNRNRFKQTLPIHMVIGIMCLGFSLLEM